MTTVGESGVHVEEVEQILQRYFKTKSTLANCQGVVISKGMGFTSEVIRLTLTWAISDDAASDLPSTIIMKAPTASCLQNIFEKLTFSELKNNNNSNNNNNNNNEKYVKMDPAKLMLIIHKTEYSAYEILIDAQPSCPVAIPVIYGMKECDPAMILMEDLGNRAVLIDNVALGLNVDQWESVIDALADLHGWSLTTRDDSWRRRIDKYDTMISNVFKSWVDTIDFHIQAVQENYGDEIGPIDAKLVSKVVSMKNMVKSQRRYDAVLPEVMLHGDTWINNILFEKDSSTGSASSRVASFIDWQLCSRGCGINDIARISSWCVNPELREQYEKIIVKRYFDRLLEICGGQKNLGTNATFDNVWRIYEHACAVYGLLGLSMIDFMLRFVSKIDEDATGWRRAEMLHRTKWSYEKAERFFNNIFNEDNYW